MRKITLNTLLLLGTFVLLSPIVISNTLIQTSNEDTFTEVITESWGRYHVYQDRCYTMDIPLVQDLFDRFQPIPLGPTIDFPDYYNWKDLEGIDWTTPAKDQGNCGSCWDFAAIGTLESIIKIREGNPNINPDLSEQYVLSCLPAAANHYGQGCSGGTPYNAFYYMMDTGMEGNNCNGALPESCMIYGADHMIQCDSKCQDWMSQLIPILDCGEQWVGFDSESNREIVKNLIYHHGPIASGINVSTEFVNWGSWHHSADDFFADPQMPWGNRLNHIIVIVGWKDDQSIPNGGYWICKNSWGTQWGYDGFFNIEYGGLFTGVYIAWVDYSTENHRPQKPQTPLGPDEWTVDEEITFETLSTDLDGDDVYYLFNWGDESDSGWIGPIASGDVCSCSMTWTRRGTFDVTVKAKDIHGYESEWSDPLQVRMPKQKQAPFLDIIKERDSMFHLFLSFFSTYQ